MGGLLSYSWWKFITLVQGARGPFSAPGEVGNARKLYELAVNLFPDGPPIAGMEWVVGAHGEVEEYVYLLSRLFKKNDLVRTGGYYFFTLRGMKSRGYV